MPGEERTGAAEPWRWRGGASGEADGNAVSMEQVDDPFQPVESVNACVRFEFCPGKNTQANKVYPCFSHQAGIFDPDLLGPLFGIVIRAVKNARREFWDDGLERLDGHGYLDC